MYSAAPCRGRRPLAAGDESLRISATVSRQQDRLLRALAERNKVSVAWLIRYAIDRLLSEGESVQLPLDLGTQR